MKHRDLYDMVVTYEDILSDPEGACRRLLEVCGIPERHLPAAVGAFETDSQNGTFGERGGSKYKMLSRRGRRRTEMKYFAILSPTYVQVGWIEGHAGKGSVYLKLTCT